MLNVPYPLVVARKKLKGKIVPCRRFVPADESRSSRNLEEDRAETVGYEVSLLKLQVPRECFWRTFCVMQLRLELSKGRCDAPSVSR